MIRIIAFLLAALSLSSAQALEIAWKGGAVATATSGCTGWNPLNNDWFAFLWPPLAGTTNTSTSTFSLHTGSSSEGFRLNNPGNFTTAFKNVTAVHDYTGAGSYQAQIKLLAQSPATILTTTPFITGRLQISKFDNTPTCLVTISFALVRHVESP